MKRLIALIMTAFICLSLFSLAGCKKTDNKGISESVDKYKDKYGFEAHVVEDAEIIGEWNMQLDANSTSKEIVWDFRENSVLYVVETVKKNNLRLTTDGAYNYNEKTGEINYMIITSKAGDDGKPVSDVLNKHAKVTFDGDTMTFAYDDGTTDIFTK